MDWSKTRPEIFVSRVKYYLITKNIETRFYLVC